MIYVILPFLLYGQSDVQIGFSNQDLLSIEITSTDFNFGMVNPVTGPVEISNSIRGVVHANTDWILFCKVESDFTSEEGYMIPIERMSYRISGGDWIPFKVGSFKIMEGSATGDDGEKFSMDVSLELKWEDMSGDFITDLDFTVINRDAYEEKE